MVAWMLKNTDGKFGTRVPYEFLRSTASLIVHLADFSLPNR